MQTLTRRPDWPEALDAYIGDRRGKRFRYGSHDCARFAAGAVKAQTGVNLMADIRYPPSRSGAERMIESHGGLLAALRARLPEISCAHAQRGDVGLIEMDGDEESLPAVCVVLGDKVVAAGPDGLVFLPRSRLRASFKV